MFFFFESKLSAGLASHNWAAALARSPDIEDSLWPGLLATSGKVSVRAFSPPSVSCRNKKHGFVKICRSLQSHWFELLSLHHGTTVGACDQAAEGRVHR